MAIVDCSKLFPRTQTQIEKDMCIEDRSKRVYRCFEIVTSFVPILGGICEVLCSGLSDFKD